MKAELDNAQVETLETQTNEAEEGQNLESRGIGPDGLSLVAGVRQAFRPQKGANVMGKRNVLGRGLSSLLSPTAVNIEPPAKIAHSIATSVSQAPAERKSFSQMANRVRESFQEGLLEEANNPSPVRLIEDDDLPEGGLVYLPLDRVVPNEDQPRKNFNQEEIESLSKSIRDTGLLQPILVRKKRGEVGPLGKYEIVAGERRYRAAKIAGLTKIPAILKQLDDRETLELSIIENVQRADLNPIEEALAYQRLIEGFGQIQAQIATTVGRDRVSIANTLRLLKLPADVQQLISDGKISSGHGRALLSLKSEAQQSEVAQRIIKDGLSVRQIEALSHGNEPENGQKTAKAKTENIQTAAQTELEERLRRALGTKVRVSLKDAEKGELHISFFSRAELENILDRVGA